MYEMGKKRYNMDQQTEEQVKARKRMALFPENGEVLFVQPDLWVPVVRLEGKLCILPGVPRVSLPRPRMRAFVMHVFGFCF